MVSFLGIATVCSKILKYLNLEINFGVLIIEGILILVVSNAILCVLYFRTEEFQYIIQLFKSKFLNNQK